MVYFPQRRQTVQLGSAKREQHVWRMPFHTSPLISIGFRQKVALSLLVNVDSPIVHIIKWHVSEPKIIM